MIHSEISRAKSSGRIVVSLGLATLLWTGCGKPESPTRVVIEHGLFEFVEIRSQGKPADLSGATIAGTPTDAELHEAAEVIGRIGASAQTPVGYVEFRRGKDSLEVSFAKGRDVYVVKRSAAKWVIQGIGGM